MNPIAFGEIDKCPPPATHVEHVHARLELQLARNRIQQALEARFAKWGLCYESTVETRLTCLQRVAREGENLVVRGPAIARMARLGR